MRRPLPNIPSLPASWTFPSRSAKDSPISHQAHEIPGEGGGWTLVALPGLSLEGEAAGLGEAFGRGGVRRLGEIVLRPYRRGGLVRHLNDRIYASPQRFAREFLVHRALWLAGFPTVEPLGYGVRRRAWGFEGVFLTRFQDCEPWPHRWDATVPGQLKAQIEALCAWGLFAPDLNATNVMVSAEGGVLLLDWDRANWEAGPLMKRYQARLLRSLAKLHAPLEMLSAIESW